MKKFKEYLNEKSAIWGRKKLWDIAIERGYFIPLSDKLSKRILGEVPTTKAFHIFAGHSAEQLIKGQTKKAGISTFTGINDAKFQYGMSFGLSKTGGGFIAELEGTMLASFEKDAYTIVDESNRRWVNIDRLSHLKSFDGNEWSTEERKWKNDIAVEIWNKRKKFGLDEEELKNVIFKKGTQVFNDGNVNFAFSDYEDRYDDKYPWLLNLKSYHSHFMGLMDERSLVPFPLKKVKNKIKAFYLKSYMEWMEKQLLKRKDDYRKLLTVVDAPYREYNEIILTNYKVNQIHTVFSLFNLEDMNVDIPADIEGLKNLKNTIDDDGKKDIERYLEGYEVVSKSGLKHVDHGVYGRENSKEKLDAIRKKLKINR
jgi:hypothetical protein